MSSRVQQDSFIDDSEETWYAQYSLPACLVLLAQLTVSYQVHSVSRSLISQIGIFDLVRVDIKRPYDDKTIEWKEVSPEEGKPAPRALNCIADVATFHRFKADLQKQARKKAELRQKEAQKREFETLNRKHLAGLRVVQKNLVYVVGLNPRIREEDLLNTLRGDLYFGQYGKIVKIVVSKGKDGGGISHGNQPLGVYVTFARQEDAASCIAAVNGSQNGDRILRQVISRNLCDITYLTYDLLLEPNTEQPNTVLPTFEMRLALTRAPHVVSQPNATSVQPMGRQLSKDSAISPTDSGDGSALPSSASWANKDTQRGRGLSQPASVSAESPMTTSATVAHLPQPPLESATENSTAPHPDTAPTHQPSTSPNPTNSLSKSRESPLYDGYFPLLDSLLRSVTSPQFRFIFSSSGMDKEDFDAITNHPPLFDTYGGVKRRHLRTIEEEELRKQSEADAAAAALSLEVPDDEQPEGGSFQLGGEAEVHRNNLEILNNNIQAIPAPLEQQRLVIRAPIAPGASLSSPTTLANIHNYAQNNNVSNLAINGRSLTPLQQQQLLLLKTNNPSNSFDQFSPKTPGGLNYGQSQLPQQNMFQSQSQPLSSQGHVRQSSRYNFTTESSSASAAVKPAANAKLMAQQSAMMPSVNSNHFQNQGSLNQSQHLGNHFYNAGVQGPPPGLKSAGTPPVSAGGMFGQGHGYPHNIGNGLGLGATNISAKDTNADMLREMLRNRGVAGVPGGSQVSDSGKREFMFPSFLQQYPSSSTPAPAPGLLGSLYGSHLGAYQDSGLQKQKKKGKKHRHANTSSSGGGGIVDLADPSILQARIQQQQQQQQQQNGASSAQGLFGSQTQGGYTPSGMMYGGSFGRW
ncbi:MAG: transcriptional repressor general negative regulator of transcription subunit 4 [Trizodia sp. TS-e1964]|nr:MAG: transcriptional repressor general negative regulator of transcription subunit 4 [Trizodia sp. TS-e1964]